MRQVGLQVLLLLSSAGIFVVVQSAYNETEYKAIVYNDNSNDNAIYYTAVSVLIGLNDLFE